MDIIWYNFTFALQRGGGESNIILLGAGAILFGLTPGLPRARRLVY